VCSECTKIHDEISRAKTPAQKALWKNAQRIHKADVSALILSSSSILSTSFPTLDDMFVAGSNRTQLLSVSD
jgi:hypothetical protein